MDKLKKGWKEFISSPKKQVRVVLIAIFLSMFILNIFTPLIADDYSYSFGVDGRIETIADVIEYQIEHYLTWGGRSIAHTIAQVFLLVPKIFFNIANALVYTVFIYLLYSITKNNKEDNVLSLITINLATWFFQPVFGQTCIWLIGSCNYLWTTTIILFFIKQYLDKDEKKDSKLRFILIFLLGILAGWTNENTSVGMLVVIIGLLLVQKFKEKKKISKWQVSGLVGAILGFIILIAAPGNYARNDQIAAMANDNTFILIKWLRRALDYTQNIETFILPLIIITIVTISVLLYKKKKVKIEVPIYLTASFFTIYAMVLSPQFPERSWFGIITFMIMAIMLVINDIVKINRFYKFIYIDIVVIGLVVFAIQYIDAARSIRTLQNIWNDRIVYIEAEKKKGNKDIIVDKYWCSNSKCPSYGLSDLYEEPEKWPNNDIAKYFGLDSIAATKTEEDD